jgi:prepilin-type N-terminal cleavage/methylation domain-containing protein
MRCNDRLKSQRGFTLIEVMTAALILSALVIGIGGAWVVADRTTNDMIMRQKAIFVASAEMERLTTLYGTTSFGATGPVTTAGYTETAAFPATRLTYPTTLDPLYIPAGQDFVTTSVTTFQTGPNAAFLAWVNSNLLASLNRTYVWVDQDHNVMARLSWTTTNITANPCTGTDGCGCLDYTGLLGGKCQKLVLYVEYPYRLVSGSAVAGANLQTVSLATIVGRHT